MFTDEDMVCIVATESDTAFKQRYVRFDEFRRRIPDMVEHQIMRCIQALKIRYKRVDLLWLMKYACKHNYARVWMHVCQNITLRGDELKYFIARAYARGPTVYAAITRKRGKNDCI